MAEEETGMIVIAEIICLWAAVFGYAAAFCIHLIGCVRNRPNGIKTAFVAYHIFFASHLAATAFRWISAGHSPVTDTYEWNITCTLIVIFLFLLFYRIGKIQHVTALVIFPIVFLLLGNAIVVRESATPMGQAYKSPWLFIHVAFAWLSFGSYLIAMGNATLILLRERLLSMKPGLNIPEMDELDDTSYRFIVLGIITQAVMIVSGAIWAKKLWGYYWNWNALESWTLMSFLLYAFYLHARSFFDWKMKKAAWIAALGLVVLSISFWGVKWFAPSLHPGP